MTFSNTVARQREQQEKTLNRFIAYSLAGSFALHGIGLCLKVNNFWNLDQPESEEIAIVVTEPSEEELAEVIPPEDSFSEPESGNGGGSGEPGAATMLEAPPASSQFPVEQDPIAEEDPEPEPTPIPIAEDIEESVEEELEAPLAESDEDVAEATPEPRNLNDLLDDLRRVREQAEQVTASNNDANGQATPSSRFGTNGFPGDGLGNTTAVGPGGLGSGTGFGSGRGTGTGEGNETGEGTNDRSSRGSRSREITCSDCDFDYPESADGAEGRAQVIVETDAQGRVVSVMLSRSSGNAALDRAALEQARRRVRLNNARAGESYPIDIDFVQPNSEAARQVRARGDRRSITISDPEPVAETSPTPTTATNQSPAPQSPESTGSSTPSVTPEPSVTPSPSPSGAANSAQPTRNDSAPESTPEPEPASPPPAPEPSNSQPPAPVPSSAPEPASPPPAPEPSNSQPPASAPPPAPAPAPSEP